MARGAPKIKKTLANTHFFWQGFLSTNCLERLHAKLGDSTIRRNVKKSGQGDVKFLEAGDDAGEDFAPTRQWLCLSFTGRASDSDAGSRVIPGWVSFDYSYIFYLHLT